MKNAVIKLLGVAIVISGFNASGLAQELDPGKTEFLSQCAICHGVDGRGNGFLSEELKTKPANLTILARTTTAYFLSMRFTRSLMEENQSELTVLVRCRFGDCDTLLVPQ